MFIECFFCIVRSFQHSELWAYLLTRLYDSQTNPNELVCADNQDKPVSCPNGYCQLTGGGSSSFTRTCVPKGSTDHPHGIIVRSKTISENDIDSSITYTCNKPMCNNSTITKEVQRLLGTRGILMYTITTTTAAATTTKITITTTTTASITTTMKRSTGNTARPMISIQCGLMLLMTIIF